MNNALIFDVSAGAQNVPETAVTTVTRTFMLIALFITTRMHTLYLIQCEGGKHEIPHPCVHEWANSGNH